MTRMIAIDGPAGSGKSTVADRLAQELNIMHLDTGAMYRALTLWVLRQGIDPANEEEVARILPTIDLAMEKERVLLNATDVSKEIRSDRVSGNVSVISSYSAVRTYLVKLQQQIAAQNDCILDGRDIGTVVLPHADLKFFLTATPEVRALRRLKDPKAEPGQEFARILEAIKKRDHFDSTRAVSPLRPADDAIILDTSEMTLDQVVATIREAWNATIHH